MAAGARTSKRRSRRTPKPIWERAYRGHAYWLGQTKLGRVTLDAERITGDVGRYSWEAAGKLGRAPTLRKAKSAVEVAVAMADRQLPLFD